MWSHGITFITGMVTGMFIAQRYNIPDVKRLGEKTLSTTMQKLKEWEKKDVDNGSGNGSDRE